MLTPFQTPIGPMHGIGVDRMFRLAYQVDSNSGWVIVRGSQHDITMIVPVFLSDPLWTLSAAAIQLLHGRDVVSFQWADEPGTWNWTIQQRSDYLSIVISFSQLSFGMTLMTDVPDVVFQTECRVVEFTGQVLSVLDQIERDVGLAAYLAAAPGSGGFPTEYHGLLRQLQRDYRRDNQHR